MRAGNLYTVLVLAAAAMVSCAEEPQVQDFQPAHGNGIVNGQLEDGFPSVVALGGSFGGQTMSMCSANLITPRVLLSAAHCGDGIPIAVITSMGQAYFGPDINNPDEAIGFVDHSIHPDYEELQSEPGGDLGQYDLSVFVLEDEAAAEPTWFKRTAPTDDDLGREITSVGFGITGPEQDDSGVKRSAVLTLDLYDEMFLLSATNTNENGANVCSGDSGGPQFYQEDERWVQAAVHSWSDVDCQYQSGSTRVDIAAEWILDRIEEVHGTRDVCEINGWYDNGICDDFCDEPDPDCEPDAGTPEEDGGPQDAGAGSGGSDGCGCTVAATRPSLAPILLLLLGAALFIRSGRRGN